MNKPWVSFHLKEAGDALQKLIREIESGTEAGAEEFENAITHAYHHLNTAWNSRLITDEKARNHTDWDFTEWRQFPKDLNLV
jgi:cellobiose-specific phosphotransferase system component IIA